MREIKNPRHVRTKESETHHSGYMPMVRGKTIKIRKIEGKNRKPERIEGMYKKILVPLDGSELAECALEHLKAIAIGCCVPEVVLLRVVEPTYAVGDVLSDSEVMITELITRFRKRQNYTLQMSLIN